MEVPSHERVCVAVAELCDCGCGDRDVLWEANTGDEVVGDYCGECDYVDRGGAEG